MQSDMINDEEKSILFNMRADTINGFKYSFKSMHRNDTRCRLGCSDDDSISHLFKCSVMNSHMGVTHVTIHAIYGDVLCQKEAVSMFTQRNNIRNLLLETDAGYQGPGQTLDTSTPTDTGGGAGEGTGGYIYSVPSLCEYNHHLGVLF